MFLVESLKAIQNRQAYRQLFEREQLLLATHESFRAGLVYVKPWLISGIANSHRYSYMACLEGMGIQEFGIAAAQAQGLAIQKAISEAYERLVFRLTRGITHFPTTNGMAAHPSLTAAIANATTELFERDALLTHWLNMTPMAVVKDWPRNVTLDKITDVSIEAILFSTEGHVSTLTLIAQSQRSGNIIFGHGSGKTATQAYQRAHVELERLATVVIDADRLKLDLRRELKDEFWKHLILSKEDRHQLDWIFGQPMSFKDLRAKWRALSSASMKQVSIIELATGALNVVKVKAPHVQELFLGPTAEALTRSEINLDRIDAKKLNPKRHFVA